MEWFETACIFILVEEDAFHDADLMDRESNFNFSSDLCISIYSIHYLLTILIRILFTSSSRESKNEIIPLTLIVSQWRNLVNLNF